MTIKNLARVLNAKLLNSPAISSVLSFSAELGANLNQGAFFCLDSLSYDIALRAEKNGAYAIVFQNSHKELDDDFFQNSEIAFIQSTDLEHSLSRLLRYLASLYDFSTLLLDPAALALTKAMHLPRQVHILTSPAELYRAAFSQKQKSLFISSDEQLLSFSAPAKAALPQDFKALSSSSIFFSSFIAASRYYAHINIAQPYAPILASVLGAILSYQPDFKLGELRADMHFVPFFISDSLALAPFGSTQKAIIAEPNHSLFAYAKEWLLKNFNENEIIILDKPNNIQSLNNKFFKYALINACADELAPLLNKTKEYPTLGL